PRRRRGRRARGSGLLRLIDQHHRDVVAHGVAVSARPADDHLLVLVVVDLAAVVRADEDLHELGVQGHPAPPSSRITASSAAVRSSSSSLVRASTFSRSSGSVLDGRTLHHQSSNSIVSPSRRSSFASANRVANSPIFPAWSATVELISPES